MPKHAATYIHMNIMKCTHMFRLFLIVVMILAYMLVSENDGSPQYPTICDFCRTVLINQAIRWPILRKKHICA